MLRASCDVVRQVKTRFGLVAAVVFILSSTSCDSASQGVHVLGSPASVPWPPVYQCPNALTETCGDEALVLTATVNLPYASVVTQDLVGGDVSIVCTWPLDAPRSCRPLPPSGATVRGEAAVYTR